MYRMYTYTYTHRCMHTETYTGMHAYTHTEMHTSKHRHACNACRDMYAHTHTQRHTHGHPCTNVPAVKIQSCHQPQAPTGAQHAAEWKGTGSSGTDSVLSSSDRGPSVPPCEARQASPHARGRGFEHRF